MRTHLLLLVFGEGLVTVLSIISSGSIEVLISLGEEVLLRVRSGMGSSYGISALPRIALLRDIIYLLTIDSKSIGGSTRFTSTKVSSSESLGSSSSEL